MMPAIISDNHQQVVRVYCWCGDHMTYAYRTLLIFGNPVQRLDYIEEEIEIHLRNGTKHEPPPLPEGY